MFGDEEDITNVHIQDLSCFSVQIEPSHFQLLRVLGQGSFGKVYLVRKCVGTDNGTLFAMKVLRKASLKLRDRIRTKMERDILANIKHPFIVQLQYAFQTEGKLYLILEYLRGGDLFSRLSKELMLPEPDVRFYLAELILALNHLHQLGIVYRDLKPENILLDIDGHVKLTDFGLSKEAVHQGDGGQTFSFCGTIEYMAPEVITRRGHDSSADWWSLGVLMFEMLCGMLPFQGDTRRDTMNQILRAKLRMPQFLSLEAQTLLRALFKRNPLNRLGYGSNGLEDLKSQAFFSTIVWEKLLDRSNPAPYLPVVSPPQASRNTSLGTLISPINDSPGPPASASAWEIFKGFNYTAEAAVSLKPTTTGHQTRERPLPGDLVESTDHLQQAEHCSKSVTILKIPDSGMTQSPANLSFSAPVSAGSDLLMFNHSFGLVKDTPESCLDSCGSRKVSMCFSRDYELRELISRGSYATLWRCVQKMSFDVFTTRIIERRYRDPIEEIEILKSIKHIPNVARLIDVYTSESRSYLVIVPTPGGSLQDRVQLHNGLSEYETSRIAEVITKTLKELHFLKIVHRELKPRNLQYTSLKQDPNSLQISEFGAAKQMQTRDSNSKNIPMKTKRDYPLDQAESDICYVSPEVRHGEGCDTSGDLWSLGVIMCFTLLGHTPGISELELKGPYWDVVSGNGKSFVSQLLTVDPGKRMTANAAVQHHWFREPQRLSRLPVNWLIAELGTVKTKQTVTDKFHSALTLPTTVLALEPVLSSQLAARRQLSRASAKNKKSSVITIHPSSCTATDKNRTVNHRTTSVITPFTANSSNFMWSKPAAIRSAGPHTLSNSILRQTNNGMMAGNFLTSTTFTLLSPSTVAATIPKTKQVCCTSSGGQTTLGSANRYRVVV